MNLRLFIALDPPASLRRRLGEIQAEMRRLAGRSAGDVKWVPPDNVHLTLQFLGAVPEERVDAVAAAIAAAAAGSGPFSLELRGAGGFPNARSPRVLWAGLAGDVEPLAALARALGERLAPLGFPPEERAFKAHLTLGRSRDPRGARGLGGAIAGTAESAGGSWRADEIVLFRSHLSPKGPRYEPLRRVRLGSAGP